MISTRTLLILAALAASPAFAQQPKTTEQQARSYILSAFMTGAAPAVLGDDVKVPPTMRERLALTPESDSRAVYFALVRVTAGKSLTVRPAKIDELERTETNVETGKPVFAMDVSDSTFVLKYDLDRDTVTNLADASRPVAVTSPVTVQEPAQPIAEAEAAKPAAEPAVPAAPAVPPPAVPATAAPPPAPPQPAAHPPAPPPPAAPPPAATPAGIAPAAAAPQPPSPEPAAAAPEP